MMPVAADCHASAGQTMTSGNVDTHYDHDDKSEARPRNSGPTQTVTVEIHLDSELFVRVIDVPLSLPQRMSPGGPGTCRNPRA
jgi:hypothetical protein